MDWFIEGVSLPANNLSGALSIGSGSLCELPVLKHIDLSDNGITSISQGPDCFPLLSTVNLARTSLTGRLPRWITRPQSTLSELHLQENFFE